MIPCHPCGMAQAIWAQDTFVTMSFLCGQSCFPMHAFHWASHSTVADAPRSGTTGSASCSTVAAAPGPAPRCAVAHAPRSRTTRSSHTALSANTNSNTIQLSIKSSSDKSAEYNPADIANTGEAAFGNLWIALQNLRDVRVDSLLDGSYRSRERDEAHRAFEYSIPHIAPETLELTLSLLETLDADLQRVTDALGVDKAINARVREQIRYTLAHLRDNTEAVASSNASTTGYCTMPGPRSGYI